MVASLWIRVLLAFVQHFSSPTVFNMQRRDPATLSPSSFTSSPLYPSLHADHAGGGADVLHAVQAEDVSQVGEQHQCRRLQLQLLPTQDRALCWYAWVPRFDSYSPTLLFFWCLITIWHQINSFWLIKVPCLRCCPLNPCQTRSKLLQIGIQKWEKKL